MGMRADFRVHAQRHGCDSPLRFGDLLNSIDLRFGFGIEATDAIFKRDGNLLIGLAHSGEHDFGSRESGIDSSLYLADAHSIGTHA